MRVKTMLALTAMAALSAAATQLVGAGPASAAPGGHLVVLDTTTGRVVETDAIPEPQVVTLDVRTGRVMMPGYEFFLPQATARSANYPGDGSEFRLNK